MIVFKIIYLVFYTLMSFVGQTQKAFSVFVINTTFYLEKVE